MEYVFGTDGAKETLKTKGDVHSNLSGWQKIQRVYPDQTITDRFFVVKTIASQSDSAGSCYDWYEIDRHYRIVDKTEPLISQAEDTDAMVVDQEYRLTLLELGITDEEVI